MFAPWRKREDSPRAFAMLMQGTVAVTLVAVSITGSVAYATWVASGVGASSSRAAFAGTGNTPTTGVTGRNVTVTWTPSTYSNGVGIADYIIKRYDAAGTVLQAMTSGSCAAAVTGTSCTEAAVPAGSWRYSVTPANGNWRGTESAKTTATVGAPSLSLTPVLTRATATLNGSAANFITGQSLTFRLDNATSGTVLAGTLAGVATPTAVSASGGGAVTVVLPAGTTSGAHTVYAVTSASGDSAGQAITVDNTAPPTPTISSSPGSPTTATTATFVFSDTEAGVTLDCTLDGGTATTCTSPLSLSALADGAHTFSVSATDAAGNTSAAATRTWTVDTTGPVNTVMFPVDGSSHTAASFTAGCSTGGTNDVCGTTSDTAGVTTVRLSIRNLSTGQYWNGGSFVATEFLLTPTGTTTWTYSLPAVTIPDGSYTIRVYATDSLGNQSIATSTVTVDTVVPPAPTVTTRPADPSTSTSATFAFTDTDPGVGFRCSLDGAAATVCTSPIVYTGLAEAAHTFSVRAVDAAGNTSTATTAAWTVDATAPANTVTFAANGSSYNTAGYNAGCSTGTGDLCGTTSDTGTGVSQVRVSVQRVSTGLYWNGTTFTSATENLRTPTGTTSWSLPLAGASLADGGYTIRVYATDAAGNSTTTLSTFTTDTVAPATPSVTVFPTGTTASSTASFTFSDTEAGVTFLCSLDGGTAVSCSSPTVFRALANGAHTFTVTAADAVGNSSATVTKSWTIAAAAAGGATTFPVNGTVYPASTYDAGCATPPGDICGTASATGGVASVALSIKQVSSGLYWNGTTFASATEVFVAATGTASWTYGLTAAQQSDGSYTVRYVVTNAAGDASQPSAATTYTIDATGPVAQETNTTNAGTIGRLGAGDTITFNTSEQLLASSVLTGWNGTSTNVTVRITDSGGADILTVWNTTNTTQLKLGQVDLGNAGWVSASITFGLAGTRSTIVQSGSTITVTLGTVSDGTKVATVSGSPDLTWTPGAGATDLVGNAWRAPASVTESDNDSDF